jgi:hypothetical protein
VKAINVVNLVREAPLAAQLDGRSFPQFLKNFQAFPDRAGLVSWQLPL